MPVNPIVPESETNYIPVRRGILARMRDAFSGSASPTAINTNNLEQPAKLVDPRRRKVGVTPKSGQASTWYRGIIKYERRGPFHRQVGIQWRNGECLPIIRIGFEHWFLHVTKGWRKFHSVPWAMQLASSPVRVPFYHALPRKA